MSAFAISLTAHLLAFQGPAIARAAQMLRAMASRPSGDPHGGGVRVDGGAYCGHHTGLRSMKVWMPSNFGAS